MNLKLNHPVRPPSDLASYHADDRDQAPIVIAIGEQTPGDVILQSISADGREAVLVAGGNAVRCLASDLTPIE